MDPLIVVRGKELFTNKQRDKKKKRKGFGKEKEN